VTWVIQRATGKGRRLEWETRKATPLEPGLKRVRGWASSGEGKVWALLGAEEGGLTASAVMEFDDHGRPLRRMRLLARPGAQARVRNDGLIHAAGQLWLAGQDGLFVRYLP
jgi:hypothetical protein